MLQEGHAIAFGPAPTRFGTIHVEIEAKQRDIDVRWTGAWRDRAPDVEVRLLGHPPSRAKREQNEITVEREALP